MGAEMLVTLDFNGQRTVARVAPDATLASDQNVWLHFPPDRVLTFDEDGTRTS